MDIEAAPVFSTHNSPQTSPQEWDCGCVTEVYVTDRDYMRGERPFEMRLTYRCGRSRCAIRRELVEELLMDERNLPSAEWPWTTDRLLAAAASARSERRA